MLSRGVTTLAVLACAWTPIAASASPHEVEVRPIERRVQFESLKKSLPQSQILDVVQDPQGYVWFATQEGLARFDGYDLRLYQHDPDDETSLSSGFVTSLEVDGHGHLWAGTGDAGLNLYDPHTDGFERLGGDDGLSSELVTALHADGDRLWVLLGEGGVDVMDVTTRTLSSHRDGPMAAVFTSVTGGGETLYFGSEGDGLVRFEPGSKTAERFLADTSTARSLPSDAVTAVLQARDGTLWIGTDDGLSRLGNGDGARFEQFRSVPGRPGTLTSDRVTTLLEDRDGTLWVGTRDGLNRFDAASGTFTGYRHHADDPSSLAYPWVTALFQDRGGLLWIGNFANGVNTFDPLRLQFDVRRTGRGSPVAFLEGARDVLWVGTYNGGLWRFDRRRNRATVYTVLHDPDTGERVDLEDTWITSLTRDNAGYLWLTTNGSGLVAFDPKTEQFFHFSAGSVDGPPTDNMMKAVSDGRGNLWIATLDSGLVYFDRSTQAFQVFTSATLPGLRDQLFTVHIDEKNPSILWIGAGNGGLIRLDTEEVTAVAYTHDADDPSSLVDDGVLSILQDEDGTLWLGTHGGLGHFDPATGESTNYGADQIGSETVWGVLQDAQERLWLTTNGGGLVRFDPSDESFAAFSAADGLQSKEYNQGGFHETSSGDLVVGNTAGFASFDPSTIVRDDYVPPVVITRYLLANEETPLPDELDLGYRDSVFTFEFAALAFAAPELNRYMYKLEGFDDAWREVDASRRFATYTNLDGGDYTFRVKGSNRHGVWSESELSVPISVAPPPWKTWWAYLLYVLTTGGLVFAYTRYQRQRVSALEHQGRLAAVERDLELTAVVQSGFLPESPRVDVGRFRLFGFYRPAEACSGDWWWYEPAGPGRHLIVVGDVTGHGPGPAMVTAAVATAFRVQGRTSLSFDERLQVLNEEVLKVGTGKYQMTLTAMDLDEQTGAFTLYSAGGLPLIRLGANEARPKVIPCRGTPLGTPEFVCGKVEGQLQPGDRAILYTDGIPEIELGNGRLLGMRRFSRMLQESRALPLDQATARLVTEADTLRESRPQDDDWTFTLFEMS